MNPAVPSAEWLAAWLGGFECGSGLEHDQSIVKFATERLEDLHSLPPLPYPVEEIA